jgi:glycerophosphoryl diester phosphodiesterase
MRRSHFLTLWFALLIAFASARVASPESSPTPADPAGPVSNVERLQRVTARKKQPHVICHRGASEFAHENTLEAYRATFELGADGNEIDIRMTSDGVLVCFHDDMLDQLLFAYGDVSEVTWAEFLGRLSSKRQDTHC